MISVDEMRTILRVEYGIKTDEELTKELKKLGGINIAIFTESPYKSKETETKENVAIA